MEKIDSLIDALDEAQWEFTLVFEGLSDEDLWRRPHPKLLSVGELAGHVASCESVFAGQDKAESPLIDERFSYYTHQVDDPVVLDLNVAGVLEELKRVHVAAKAGFQGVTDYDSEAPWGQGATWYQALKYQVFHVAYHCGQAYSVRHLMGHTTTDN
jgi:hypothetical protein